MIEQSLRSAPRQVYSGWIYREDDTNCSEELLNSTFCSATPDDPFCRMTVCKDGGTFSTVLVIDDEKEQEAGWGRGYSVTGEEIDEATPLQPDEVVVSETIASSLQLLDRDRVYIKLSLPSAFATIVQGESDDIALFSLLPNATFSRFVRVSRGGHVVCFVFCTLE